jgi:curved DNA-binding protein CbpA
MPAREPDPYAVLGIAHPASRAEVARAFRSLAKQHHPDVAGGDADAMRKVNWAWHVLSDPARRAAWDAAHAIAESRHWAADRRSRPPPSDEWSADASWTSWAEYQTGAGRSEPVPARFSFGCAPVLVVIALLMLFVLFAGLLSSATR